MVVKFLEHQDKEEIPVATSRKGQLHAKEQESKSQDFLSAKLDIRQNCSNVLRAESTQLPIWMSIISKL